MKATPPTTQSRLKRAMMRSSVSMPFWSVKDDRAIRQHRLDLRQDLVEIIRLDGEDDQIRCGQLLARQRPLADAP